MLRVVVQMARTSLDITAAAVRQSTKALGDKIRLDLVRSDGQGRDVTVFVGSRRYGGGSLRALADTVVYSPASHGNRRAPGHQAIETDQSPTAGHFTNSATCDRWRSNDRWTVGRSALLTCALQSWFSHDNCTCSNQVGTIVLRSRLCRGSSR